MAEEKKGPKVEKGKAGNIKRTYTLTAEERSIVQNLQSVMGILKMLRQGLNYSLTLELAKVRDRLGIKESDAPEGFERMVDMDPEKYEMIVYDIKKVKGSEAKPGEAAPDEPLKN